MVVWEVLVEKRVEENQQTALISISVCTEGDLQTVKGWKA